LEELALSRTHAYNHNLIHLQKPINQSKMEAAIRKKDRMQITKYFKSGNFLREKL